MDSPTPEPQPDSPPSPAPPRAIAGLTRAERIGKMSEWMLAGMKTSQVANEWKRAGWGELTPAEALTVAEEAHAIIRADAEVAPELEDAIALNRLRDLYSRSLEIQDHKTALRAAEKILTVVARIDIARKLAAADLD